MCLATGHMACASLALCDVLVQYGTWLAPSPKGPKMLIGLCLSAAHLHACLGMHATTGTAGISLRARARVVGDFIMKFMRTAVHASTDVHA